MSSQPALFTDCRFCLEKKRHVLPISEEISQVYFAVTQMKLARLHSYSNSVCLLCYKKLLSAQSYREMLIQIEQKLLSTFNHTQLRQAQGANKAIRSNGAPRTPLVQTPGTTQPATARKFARQQLRQHTTTVQHEEDDDMSLLDEIVSFDAPNPTDFINEQDHESQFEMNSDEETKEDFEDDEGSTSYQVKSASPTMDANDSRWTSSTNPDKPFKCNYPGCRQSSSTRTALLKHRRRVHGIRMRQSVSGGKITRSRPSHLYHDLELSSAEFKCRFCQMSLRNRRVLLRHIETVHMQAKFYCTVPGCNHASTRKDNYRLHLKNYHRDLPEEQMERVLAETRDMKPIYENNVLELQIKREELNQEIALEEGQVISPDDPMTLESVNEALHGLPKNGEAIAPPELPGYSIIDISGEFE